VCFDLQFQSHFHLLHQQLCDKLKIVNGRELLSLTVADATRFDISERVMVRSGKEIRYL